MYKVELTSILLNTLYLVDAIGILFRSYYAIGPMTNPKGESTNALYGFIRSFYKLIDDFSPHHIAAIFDGPENKQKRIAIYGEYKSHRQGMPPDLFHQLEQAIHFCNIAGIPTLSIPGVEADDVMGAIALWAEKKGANVFLCSTDKDLCQLVSKNIFVLNVFKNNLILDRDKVKENFGVFPEQMVDYLAMVGDASDNIPGIEGFGPKTTADLLEKFGSLDALLSHPEKVAGAKKQAALREGKEIALLSRKLAMLHTDIDFPKEESFFRLKAPDTAQLQAFFREMHFLSLLKDMGKESSQEVVQYVCVEEEKELEKLVARLIAAKTFCVDTETTDIHPMQARMVGIGLGVEAGKAWYVPLNGKLSKATVMAHLKRLLSHPAVEIFGHNIKYDCHILLNEGLPLPPIAFDTIVASYLLTPHQQRHNLDDLSLERFGKVKIPTSDLLGKGKKQITMDQVPIEKVSNYCCEDVDYTCRLQLLFEPELAKGGLQPLFKQIELPLIGVLLEMERIGIYVDVKQLEEMSHSLRVKIDTLEKQIYALAGEDFNLNSPKQLSAILFDKLGIKPPKKTATGFSTSAEVLEFLQEEVPIVAHILDYRTLEKLRSTYVDALPSQILPATGRIHCTFNQSVAATGRLSCQNPNLQNIPVRTDLARTLRSAFKPQKRGFSFLSADYSQIELRLLAHFSEDPLLLAAFHEGEDIHASTAAKIFNIPLKEVTPLMRHQAKAVNFGILYGQQAFGLSQGLKIDFKEAASFIDTYFHRYKKVKEFIEFCKESVRKTGRAVTLTGRQRPIPEIHSTNPAIRAVAERLAVNTPLQGTAADLIKIAMVRVDAWLRAHPTYGAMVLQIHDELLFEVDDTHLNTLNSNVKEIMEGVMLLKVPLIVDVSIGKNWGEC